MEPACDRYNEKDKTGFRPKGDIESGKDFSRLINSMKTLEQLSQEINKCVLCGTCRSVCPTFGVVQREPASARGKVALC
ncbi:MAG: 4Fe-4S dicluster domain-containing protein, partial [Deltaproteobacteria bacterium]